MIKPKLETSRQTDSGLFTMGTTVKDAMTTNAAEFPGSASDVTALGTELTQYQADLQAVENNKLALQGLVDAKDASRSAVEARLRTLGFQVSLVANGDPNVIHDAGMQASNEPSPVILGQVTNLRLTPSEQDGELLGRWNKVDGARMYRVQISLDTGAPVNWADKLNTTKTKCSLNHDLVSGSKVWVRVCATGANGDGPWSDVGRKTVP